MSDDTCTFPDGCDRPVEVKKWKLCRNHYMTARSRGMLCTESEDGTGRPLKCSKQDCKRAARALGLCRPHLTAARIAGELPRDCAFASPPCGRPRHDELYCRDHERQIERGFPLKPLRRRLKDPAGECYGEAGECGLPVRARGMCPAHYYQWSRGLPLTKINRDSLNLIGTPCLTCAEHGEVRKARLSDGLCQSHYERKRKGQPNWDGPIKHKAPDGAGVRVPAGYRKITHEGRSRSEHRVIAERLLGRPLLPAENIHHINGDRADNRTDGPFVMDDRGRLWSGNLEIWNTMQPAGQQVGAKVSYSVEILAQYGEVAPLWEADLDVLERVLAAHGRTVVRSRQRPKMVG